MALEWGLTLIWFWRGLPAGLILRVVRLVLGSLRLVHHGYAGSYLSRNGDGNVEINSSPASGSASAWLHKG